MATAKTKTTKTVNVTENIIKEKPDVCGDSNKKTTPAIIPEYAMINVKSNSFGKLIYYNKKTGEHIIWENCGDIQQMSLATLRAMKTENIKFYRDQLIILAGFADENAEKFTPADIYKQLYVAQYYQNLIDPSDYETLCNMEPDVIKAKVSLMSAGAKENLAVALNTFIEKGVLDSIKRIKAFEEVLGCELMNPD